MADAAFNRCRKNARNVSCGVSAAIAEIQEQHKLLRSCSVIVLSSITADSFGVPAEFEKALQQSLPDAPGINPVQIVAVVDHNYRAAVEIR
ncbi:hypothetical protein JJB09_25600 [Rhizobium sp. KVB221]|uniref:Uncharacterized protein n=1 Tax=Rhizobium setariae TaxID=2801340 RepID=A0A936YWA6_9HYPH|nr:hypothetical protein [Rhizobium setariae]MBL0375391.1 hypothetical protein [Rhizobium setariae]